MTSQEALATPDVVIGTLSIFCDNARVLIDPGEPHYFISREYVTRVEATPVPLVVAWRLLHPQESPYGLTRCLRVACFLLRIKIWKQI